MTALVPCNGDRLVATTAARRPGPSRRRRRRLGLVHGVLLVSPAWVVAEAAGDLRGRGDLDGGDRGSAEGAAGVGVRRRRRGVPDRLRRDVAERVPLASGPGGRVHGDELGAGPPRRGVDRLHGGEPRPLLEPPPGRPRPCARRPPLRLAQRALHRAGDGECGGARVAHAPAGRDLARPRPAQPRARAPASRRGPARRRARTHARRARAARCRRPPPDCGDHPGAGC